MKVYDLVKKYGWIALADLINAGITPLPNANVFFVDSGATNTLDAADQIHGNSWDEPFATLNFAISRCTASQGDIILLAPGHTETIQDTGTASGTTTDEVSIDKAGISIIGLGRGSLRPTFTLNGATDAAINILAGATDVMVKNIIITLSDLGDVVAGLTLSATSDGALIEDVEIRDGGTNVLELVTGISIAAACDDVTIRRCRLFTTDGGTGTLNGILFAGASARSVVEDCYFRGDWNTAAINGNTAAGTDILIQRNVINQVDAATGKSIDLHASTTGAVVDNRCHAGKDGTHMSAAGCLLAENYETNAEGAQGFYGTAQDS
jgi:hypothetical protein